MKRRTPVLAVIAAVAFSAAGLSPAHAALDDPVVADLDASVAGHVTGTVTSVAPFVTVRLAVDVAPEVVTMTAGSGTFDLETWGYAGPLPVLVASCDDAELTACSTETASAATFSPTDVLPTEVGWPTDTTVGPDDTPTVTVTDTGGGDLRAIWVNPGDDLGTAVTRGVATPLTLSDGSGLVRLVRCRTGSTSVCTAFSPDQTVDLDVHTVLAASVGTIDDLTDVSTSSDVVVDTDATGTYELSWSLEQDGSPITAESGSDTGTLDGAGAADPFTLNGGALPAGVYDVLVTITVTDPDFGTFPAASATGSLTVLSGGPTVTATVGSVAPVTQGNASSTVTVDTDAAGTYELTWSLEQNGTPVPAVGGTPTGTLDGNGAATFSLGTGLADGDYDILVSIVVTEPGVGTYPAATDAGTVRVDRTGPGVTLSRSVATIYPLIATTSFPTLTRIDVTGDPTPITGFVVRTAGGTVVRHLNLNVNKTVWNGRNDAGKVVATGTYSVFAVDADGNRSGSSVAVTVSRQVLVLKSFVKEVTASGSMYDKFVGRCSTLKVPSSRGTKGSLGFFANTKCGTQTFASSAVSTAHTVRVPAAAKFLDMRVNVTGGAAIGYKGSKGVLRYLTTQGTWANETVMSSDYGIHRGPTRSPAGIIDANNYLVWGFLTAYGSRYDVTRFTVVVRYYVLG